MNYQNDNKSTFYKVDHLKYLHIYHCQSSTLQGNVYWDVLTKMKQQKHSYLLNPNRRGGGLSWLPQCSPRTWPFWLQKIIWKYAFLRFFGNRRLPWCPPPLNRVNKSLFCCTFCDEYYINPLRFFSHLKVDGEKQKI